MDATLEAKLKSQHRLGTFFVDLPTLTTREGVPCVAQMRRLRGQDISVYLREQNRLSFLSNKQRQLRQGQSADLTEAEQEKGTVKGGMTEAEEKNIYQIVASMRALLQNAVLRIFLDVPESLQVYKISANPTGEHAENEVSLDFLEPDYSVLVNRLMVKSGLIPDMPFPPSQPGDAGDAGRASEEVRPAAEPVGERVDS